MCIATWGTGKAISNKVMCMRDARLTSHALVARVWLPRISYSSQGLVAH